MTPGSPADIRAKQQIFQAVLNESNAIEVRNAIEDFLKPQLGSQTTRYLPTHGELRTILRELRGMAGVPNGQGREVDCESQIPEDYIPIENRTNPDPSSALSDAHPELRWMQLPPNESGKHAAKAMARDAFASGTAAQDGLNIFCRNAETQKNFQGHQLESGAGLLLPKEQTQALLASLAVKIVSPDAAKVLSLIQALLPVFTGTVGSGALRDIIQNWAQKNLSSALDLSRFFASCLEIFQQAGLGTMDGAQELFVFLVQESGAGVGVHGMEDSLQQLSQQLSDMTSSSLPHVNGLNEFLGRNARNSLSQLLQPLLRIFSGLFLMKPEHQWPRALPNEKGLAELATLFASQSQSNGSKRRRSRSRKRKTFRSVFGMTDSGIENESRLEWLNDPNEKIEELAS